jgi:hypothetical protein
VFSGLLLAPFVFALRPGLEVELRLNHEVADAIWAPVGPMMSGASAVVKELERNGTAVRFPGFSVGDQIVWGLTHRVLESFFELLR